MASQPEPTVFHTVLARLAAAGIHCEVISDGKLSDQTHGAYTFADDSQLTWGTQSSTGVENSITHPVSAHGRLGGFFIDDVRDDVSDEGREFTTGDFETDAAAFVTWVTALADQHGRATK
ncbi:hypothetical protein ACOT81_38075 [Streptomyces sp. WI04-05B]|uniref:hypothetical protein n=1 Tax=Streptomyces TaxID=1883 RepID=UPI0029A4D7CE|nr:MULTISPECIES: hypothetical protein [unclassified Streptomyces]MDX2545874.1 hypothetical protein [Streptomyces sp. WI04-05B]MDX2586433.1 hypothetical protein [Streptomyces sp. WI04-05A]